MQTTNVNELIKREEERGKLSNRLVFWLCYAVNANRTDNR